MENYLCSFVGYDKVSLPTEQTQDPVQCVYGTGETGKLGV